MSLDSLNSGSAIKPQNAALVNDIFFANPAPTSGRGFRYPIGGAQTVVTGVAKARRNRKARRAGGGPHIQAQDRPSQKRVARGGNFCVVRCYASKRAAAHLRAGAHLRVGGKTRPCGRYAAGAEQNGQKDSPGRTGGCAADKARPHGRIARAAVRRRPPVIPQDSAPTGAPTARAAAFPLRRKTRAPPAGQRCPAAATAPGRRLSARTPRPRLPP